MTKLDILIVNPPHQGSAYSFLFDEAAAIEVPVWAGLIAQFARSKNYSVDILDCAALGLTIEDSAKRITDINALLSVFVVYGHQPSASSQLMPDAIKCCHYVKDSSDCYVMFVGLHPSALPEQTLIESKADFVCTGEGPYTVIQTVDALKSKSDFSMVSGLCFRSDSKTISLLSADNIVVTSSSNLIENLNIDLPGVAWDLLPMDSYRAHNWHCFDHIEQRQPYASVYTSLGCPFKCNFCCINAPFGKSTIRYLSPENVIKEIEILVENYGIRNIKIPDEMFVLHEHHVIGICDLIIDRGYDLNIWAYARIDTVQEEFLEKLKLSGFNWLALGIESGSSHVRDGARKKINEHNIIDTVSKIKSHDIYVVGNYIFGLPDDTHETMKNTFDLASELNTEYANFYCAMAYPGSPLHKWAKINNVDLPEGESGPGWVGYAQHSYYSYPLSNKELTRSDILSFRDMSHISYFKSDRYRDMILKKFGQNVLNHIDRLVTKKLDRKY